MIEMRGPWLFNNDRNSGYLNPPYLVLERDEKHYFRKYRGFAISKDIYNYVQDKGVRYYEIHYVSEMKVLIFNLQDFRTGHKVMFSGEIQYILPSNRAIQGFVVDRFTPQHMSLDKGVGH